MQGVPPVNAERTELVTVFQTGHLIALALAKAALESQGIAFVTQGEGLQDLIGLGRFPGGFNVAAGPVKLHVDIRDAALAREVLADIENP
jgi:putative signal transducing protein